jgi:hypothetical protein
MNTVLGAYHRRELLKVMCAYLQLRFLAGHAVKLSWDLFVLGVDDKEKKSFIPLISGRQEQPTGINYNLLMVSKSNRKYSKVVRFWDRVHNTPFSL